MDISDYSSPLLLCLAPVLIAEIGQTYRDHKNRQADTTKLNERIANLEERVAAIESWKSGGK